MRRPFTRQEAIGRGLTDEALAWAVATGRMQRPFRGVYLEGAEPVQPFERALAAVIVSGGVASHSVAGMLYDFDGVRLSRPWLTNPRRTRHRFPLRLADLPADRLTILDGYRCTNGLQTLLDLATVLDDLRWEQALEAALRLHLMSVDEIVAAAGRANGTGRVKRVLKLRPPGAPPTESLLETLMVQLIRTDPSLPAPERQVWVRNSCGQFVGRVDLAYPRHSVFIELDGMQHLSQPIYDATRQTAIVAATGWRPARFTWADVTKNQRHTLRRLGQMLGS